MFLRNNWYAAMWARDLGVRPVSRTLLNERIVLFRTASGAVGALEDCCCHRAAPLSKGEVDGELLVCGYHGLRFNSDGECVLVPQQKHIPPGAQVKSYPSHEKWKLIWIWMGEPDKADTNLIPNLYWLEDENWFGEPGYIHVKANYQFIVDNLLDFTHVTYVHKNTLAGDPAEAAVPMKVERVDNGLRVRRLLEGTVPPPLFAKAGNFKGRVDRWQYATWYAPSTVCLDVGCATAGTGAASGDRSRGISIWSSHIITPETAETSHYMYCYVRNFALNDPEMSRLLHEGASAAYAEDADILEALQFNRANGSLDGLIDINSDGPQLQARRMIDAMIKAERA